MQKVEQLLEALNSGKNLLIKYESGTGLSHYTNTIIKKAYFVSGLDNINKLFSVLNDAEKLGIKPIIFEIESCDFMLASMLKSLLRDGEINYITPTKNLRYFIKNRIIITTTKPEVFDILNIGAEESNCVVVNFVSSPEEKIQWLKQLYFNNLIKGVTHTKAEEIFTFCESLMKANLNLRHLTTVVSIYRNSKTGTYKRSGSHYLKAQLLYNIVQNK